MSTPTQKEPAPSALDELRQRKQNGEELTIIENCVLLAKNETAACELVELYQDRAERDEAQKRAEVAEAENKRIFAGMLAMMNTNQARAQSAAQSTAKIAQDLQNFLREHTSDVVKLEA